MSYLHIQYKFLEHQNKKKIQENSRRISNFFSKSRRFQEFPGGPNISRSFQESGNPVCASSTLSKKCAWIYTENVQFEKIVMFYFCHQV